MRPLWLLVVASRLALVFHDVLVVQLPEFLEPDELVASLVWALLPLLDAKGTRCLKRAIWG
jgi:hypothetical protein